MKKILAIALLISSLFCSVASASYADEYKAKYPKKVKTWTEQLSSGKLSTITDYFVFKSKGNGVSLRVADLNGIKVCYISYGYSGERWRFYDGISWGDGKEAHELTLMTKPRHDVMGHRAVEVITAAVNPEKLKNAIVIHAHSELNGNEVAMNESHKRWKEWKEAVDAAAKLMTDK